jgi:hypothetical protein
MKRYLLVLSCFLTFTYFVGFAQDQVAVHISPGIAFGRVHTDPDTAGFGSNGIGLGGKVGAMYDWNIKDNYYLSAGLAYSTQQIGVKNSTIQEQHRIQYLQVPVLLKLYTSELDLDLRGYAQVGFMGALKINNRVTSLAGKEVFVTKLRMWEVGLLVSCGAEYNLSLSTSIFAGISYQLGLSSMLVAQRDNPPFPKLYGYGDLITLDIGVRF